MMLTTDALLVPDRVSVPRRVGRRDAGGGPAVAIIGAGFSGTMAAIHLRRVLPPDYIVVLFDRTGRFARGPAYAMSKTPHLLNVRSVNMSALPDDPSHFERWLGGQASHWPGEVQTTEAGTFATRRLYGRYLRALLYEEMTLSGGRVRLCASDTVGLTPSNGGWTLHLAGGRSMTAAAVVLAVGNLPSTRPSDGLVFHIRDHGAAAADTMEVQRVIHATGIGAGTAQDGLIADLISAGQARTDEHGMGLDVTETLRVIDHDGHPQARLWALGPIVRGVFWECTAVPDIRLQARLIATEMAGHSSGLSMLAEARPAQSG